MRSYLLLCAHIPDLQAPALIPAGNQAAATATTAAAPSRGPTSTVHIKQPDHAEGLVVCALQVPRLRHAVQARPQEG